MEPFVDFTYEVLSVVGKENMIHGMEDTSSESVEMGMEEMAYHEEDIGFPFQEEYLLEAYPSFHS